MSKSQQPSYVQPCSPFWDDVKLAPTTHRTLTFFKSFDKKFTGLSFARSEFRNLTRIQPNYLPAMRCPSSTVDPFTRPFNKKLTMSFKSWAQKHMHSACLSASNAKSPSTVHFPLPWGLSTSTHMPRRVHSGGHPTTKTEEPTAVGIPQERRTKKATAVDISQEQESPAVTSIPKRWNKKFSERGTRDQVCYKAWEQATWRAKLQATVSVKQAAHRKHKRMPCIKLAPKHSQKSTF